MAKAKKNEKSDNPKPSKQISQEEKYKDILIDLMKQRDELREKIGIKEENKDEESKNIVLDSADEASEIMNSAFSIRVEEREFKLLKKIEKTIQSIKDGEYGLCDKCGKEINYERLKARPVASLCIECKTEQEKKERRKKTRGLI